MLHRPSFRINKIANPTIKTKRLHSEGNKNPTESTSFTDFQGEVPSPTLRGLSPTATISVRRNIFRSKQQRLIMKTKNKDNRQYTISEAPEVSLPEPVCFDIKSVSLKEQPTFALIPIPADEDFERNSNQIKNQGLVIFSQKHELRKYSESNSPTTSPSKIVNLDLSLYSEIQKVLVQLKNNLLGGSIMGMVQRYMQIVSQGALDDFHNIVKVPEKRCVIERLMRYQRCVVLIVAMNGVVQKLQRNYTMIYSVLKCCTESRVLVLSLLKKQMNRNNLRSFQSPSFFNAQEVLKGNNMEVKNFEIIQSNNQIILNLIHKLTAQKNYFTEALHRLLKDEALDVGKYFYQLLEGFSFYLHLSQLQDKAPFLAIAPSPYLPPSHKYTLVIDIFDVMFDEESSCFRPQSQFFIEEMSEYYEIVSYSAKMPREMEPLIRFLDRKNKIKHKLYKQHFIKSPQGYKKDLSRIGRPLPEILLVDTKECSQNPTNTFIVKKWEGNGEDKSLQQTIYFLSSLPLKNLNIQESIKKHKEEQARRKQKPRRYSYWNN